MFNPADFEGATENDRATFTASVGDLVDLDAVLVVSSGNINVSHSSEPTMIDNKIEMISLDILGLLLQPTQHCFQANSPWWLSAQLNRLAFMRTTVKGWQQNWQYQRLVQFCVHP